MLTIAMKVLSKVIRSSTTIQPVTTNAITRANTITMDIIISASRDTTATIQIVQTIAHPLAFMTTLIMPIIVRTMEAHSAHMINVTRAARLSAFGILLWFNSLA